MGFRKARRVRNMLRHHDMWRQRENHRREMSSMRQALDMVETEKSRIWTMVSIGPFRLVKLCKR